MSTNNNMWMNIHPSTSKYGQYGSRRMLPLAACFWPWNGNR
jgi:hypothetical protein